MSLSPAPRTAAALAVPVLALLWGLNWPAVRVVLSWWSPWTLRAVGMGAGALLLFALARWRGQALTVPANQRLRLVMSALLTFVGFNLGTAFAQLSGSTSRAAIVTFTMPIWAVLFAWLFTDEKPDAWRLAAVACGLAGLGVLGAPLLAAGVSPLGPLFALAGGVSWAAGTVFVKRFPLAATVAPVAGTAWQLTIGALVCLIGWLLFGAPATTPFGAPATTLYGAPATPHFGVPAGVGGSAPFAPLWFWTALTFHVVFATALAYLIWFDVVSRLPAGVAALGTLLIPVVGVAGAMLLLGERPSASDLAGFGLIITAATLALIAPQASPTTR